MTRRVPYGAAGAALAALLLMLLAGCGGGGGDSAGTAAPAAAGSSQPPAASNATAQAPVANVIPVVVDPGPSNDVNVPFVTVTLCAPGSERCQTIDHVLVDTGSVGLRLFAAALDSGLALPQQFDAGGKPLAECMQFADGYTWGPVKAADVRLAGERAAAVPVHIMGDPGFASAPDACSGTGADINSVRGFGANGVLGVGLFVEDCGPACAASGNPGLYYACDAGCTPVAMPLVRQVQNPVARFAADNNGVILALPPVPLTGAASASGTLTFGIGTQPNNGLGAATVLAADPATGNISTVYNGRTLARSFIDSGSNGIFFRDTAIPRCAASFYCPPAMLTLSATNLGRNGTQSTVTFNVVNADEVFTARPDAAAVAGLASANPDSNSFDWGLPFFFGRSIYTALEGRTTPGGPGPYFAY